MRIRILFLLLFSLFLAGGCGLQGPLPDLPATDQPLTALPEGTGESPEPTHTAQPVDPVVPETEAAGSAETPTVLPDPSPTADTTPTALPPLTMTLPLTSTAAPGVNIPPADIEITTPGALSKVVSPIPVRALLVPGPGRGERES